MDDETIPDAHGFFVAGWGPIQSCPTALTQTWSLNISSVVGTGSLYIDHTSALAGYAARPFIVPYVVDFPGGVDRTQQNITSGALSDQLQRPRPRPFYCSAYDDPATNPVRPDGSPSDSNFEPQYPTGYWRFYTLPVGPVVIRAERLYFPLGEWFWNAGHCANLADCGG